MCSWSSLGRRQLPLCCPAGDAGGLHHQAGHQRHDVGDLNPDHVVGQAEQEASCLGSDGQGGSEGSLPALNLYPVASPSPINHYLHHSLLFNRNRYFYFLWFEKAWSVSLSLSTIKPYWMILFRFHFQNQIFSLQFNIHFLLLTTLDVSTSLFTFTFYSETNVHFTLSS